MKKLEKIKYMAFGAATAMMITTMTIPAVAANTTKSISVIYNNIKLYVDGILVTLKDANGNVVEPFIYNGTTYLPVRAVGDAVGKPVTWKGETNSVYLGTVPGTTANIMDILPPYKFIGSNGKAFNNSDGKSYFTMFGEKYTKGFQLFQIFKTSGSSALFNTNGKYSKMTFLVGRIDDTSARNSVINIYLDGVLSQTIDVDPDLTAQKVTIPINKAVSVKIEVIGTSDGLSYTAVGFAEGTIE